MADGGRSVPLSRRGFLAGALGGAAGFAVACSSPTPEASGGPATTAPGVTAVASRPDPGAPRRVVVVGAGLAGLTAALDLRDAGWDVVVLEARGRVGGRVHTLREPFTDGLHAEGGGESIDDNHDRIQAMVKRFGLATEARPAANRLDGVVYDNGRRVGTREFAARANGSVGVEYLGYGAALDQLAAGVDPAHPERATDAIELDGRTLASLIAGLHLSPDADLLVRTEARGEFNAEPADVSLLFAVQQAAAVADVPDSASETMRIAGGNTRLLEAMAADLGDRVVLASPVDRIEHGADGVRVICAGRTVDAAHVILALPIPPLRAIAFNPALPPSVAAMVAGLDLGTAAKVATQYERRFWEDQGSTGFTVTSLPFGVAWAATDSYASTGGILSQFITGQAARDAAAMDDATRVRTFQEQLDIVYPEGVPLRTDHAATVAWANEGYTGGGYAVYHPGQMVPFWPVLREGFGRVRFAGEHTEALAGYMESAVRSGHRVAQGLAAPPPA